MSRQYCISLGMGAPGESDGRLSHRGSLERQENAAMTANPAFHVGYTLGSSAALPMRFLGPQASCDPAFNKIISFVVAISAVLALLMVPLGIIGIALHVASIQIGFAHSAMGVRTSIVALIVDVFSGVIAGALNKAAGGPTGPC